jgi:hypothetical protein
LNIWLSIKSGMNLLLLLSLGEKPREHLIWGSGILWIVHENEVPLIIIQLQVHWVVGIWSSGWVGSLSHDEEFGLLSFPWGGFVKFFFLYFSP